jgi:AcrR family transcriptional regulator
LRERNVEARRQRILEAARGLIAGGGIAALSMRRLANEAGLSVTTLYNLYGVREEILQALVMDAIDRMDRVLELEAPLDDPIEHCRAMVSVSVRHMVDNEAVFRPMAIAELEASLAGRGPRREAPRRAVRMHVLAIQAAMDQGTLKDQLDPVQLGHQVYHGFEYANIQWALGLIDAGRFEAQALYGLNLVLLGVAMDSIRPEIEVELQRLETRLRPRAPRGKQRARGSS